MFNSIFAGYKMSTQYKSLKEITPTSRFWTAKIRVDYKNIPRSSPNNSSKYQRFFHVDSTVKIISFFLSNLYSIPVQF